MINLQRRIRDLAVVVYSNKYELISKYKLDIKMSLVFQDFQSKRINDLASLAVQKPSKRRNINENFTNATRAGILFTQYLGKFGPVYDATAQNKILKTVIAKRGFEHLNMGLLAATIVFLNENRLNQDNLGKNIAKLQPEVLDPYVKIGTPVDNYNLLDPYTKGLLYATIFRYIDWYFLSRDDKYIDDQTINQVTASPIKQPEKGELDEDSEDELDPESQESELEENEIDDNEVESE